MVRKVFHVWLDKLEDLLKPHIFNFMRDDVDFTFLYTINTSESNVQFLRRYSVRFAIIIDSAVIKFILRPEVAKDWTKKFLPAKKIGRRNSTKKFHVKTGTGRPK